MVSNTLLRSIYDLTHFRTATRSLVETHSNMDPYYSKSDHGRTEFSAYSFPHEKFNVRLTWALAYGVHNGMVLR